MDFDVIEAQYVAGYVVKLKFKDGTAGEIDLGPELWGPMFEPLRDLEVFKQFRVDPECHTLVWPNGADFDPATLHDWPQYFEALVAAAQRWESGSQGERETA